MSIRRSEIAVMVNIKELNFICATLKPTPVTTYLHPDELTIPELMSSHVQQPFNTVSKGLDTGIVLNLNVLKSRRKEKNNLTANLKSFKA